MRDFLVLRFNCTRLVAYCRGRNSLGPLLELAFNQARLAGWMLAYTVTKDSASHAHITSCR
jgi:hypothetical protein